MPEYLQFNLVTYLVQAAGAVILALVLLYFYRLYKREYLIFWSWSWWAFSIFLLDAAISFAIYGRLPAGNLLRLTASIIGSAGGYLQVALLLLGTYWLVRNKPFPARAKYAGLAILLAIAVASQLLFLKDPSPSTLRFFTRVSIRALLMGLGFLGAGIGLLKLRAKTPGVGRLLVAMGFLTYSLEQFQYFVSGLRSLLGSAGGSTYLAALGIADILIQSVIGLGMIIWLLEVERQKGLQTSDSLRESEDKFRDLAESADAAIWIYQQQRLRYVNPAAEKITGYAARELCELPVETLLDPASRYVLRNVEALETSGQRPLAGMELRLLTRDGTPRWIDLRLRKIEYEGRPALLGTAIDITGRKNAEKALRVRNRAESLVSNAALRLLAVPPEHMDDEMCIILGRVANLVGADAALLLQRMDTDSLFKQSHLWVDMRVGPLAEPNLALDERDLHWLFAGLRKPPAVLMCGAETLPAGARAEQDIISRLQARAVAWIPVRSDQAITGMIILVWRTRPCETDTSSLQPFIALGGILLAMQARKRSAEAVAESEARIRLILDNALDAVITADEHGNITGWNIRAEELFGWRRDEILGKSLADTIIPPDYRQAHQSGLLRYRETNEGPILDRVIETEAMRRSGEVFPVEMAVFALRQPGKSLIFSAFLRDISRRRAAERERLELEQNLRRAQKLETIGTLAGGIAHDFNNLLAPILGYTEMALQAVPQDSQISSDLQQVIKASLRAKNLVQQILTFSRRAEYEPKLVELQKIIDEAVRLLRATLPATIDIQCHLDNACKPVFADPTQLHQLVMNLCTNAFHAMRDTGGVLDVTLDMVTIKGKQRPPLANLREGEHVRLQVSDTGKGMEPETIDRIFEPFFTTKAIGEGTGLGLSVVHGIVSGYGGAIAVHSRPKVGTRFEIYLPAADSAQLPVPPRPANIAGGRERILFIDDEEAIAALGKRMLENLNYVVTVKTDALDALNLFRQEPHGFDLIVTDQTMPNLTGDQFAREVLHIRPEMPIILTTGYSETILPAESEALGIKAYIMKPYIFRELGKIVRGVLDRSKMN